MDAPPPDFGVLAFSTDDVATQVRLDVWRDILKRKLLKVRVDPINNEPYRAEVEMRVLPGVRAGVGTIGPCISRGGRDMVASDNDDVIVLVNLDDSFTMSQRGFDLTLSAGQAGLINCAEPGMYVRPTAGRLVCVRFSHAQLAPRVADLHGAMRHAIPADAGALRLLTGYVRLLCDESEGAEIVSTPELRHLAEDHLRDLAALAIGATRDAAQVAASGGVRAARLKAVKTDINDCLGRSELSVDFIATRHAITPRHLHRLFESEGITFSAYVLERRLERARGMLTDSRFASTTISAIAFLCGFGDVSYFNRTFRRRHGMTPSDVRHQKMN